MNSIFVPEKEVVIINMILYIALALYCIIRYRFKNLATLASLLYAIGGISSYLLFIFPLYSGTFSGKSTCHIDACLYMFSINGLFILSLSKMSMDHITHITHYNSELLLRVQKLVCMVFTAILVVEFPTSIWNYFTYGDLGILRDMSRELAISNVLAISILQRLFGATSILLLSITVIRLLIYRHLTSWDKYAMLMYLLYKLNIIFSLASRATMIWAIIEVLVVLVLFWSFMSKTIKRGILLYFSIILIAFYSITVTISIARFGNVGNTQQFATLQYAGQANLNAMALAYKDLKQPFMGYIQFPLFRRILGLDYDKGKDQDFVYNTYVRDKLGYPNPVYIFHGLAGDLYLNFGWLTPVILAITIYIFMRKRRRSNYSISSFGIIMAIFMASVICKGVFFLDYRSESGNLLLVYLCLFYFILNKYGRTVRIAT